MPKLTIAQAKKLGMPKKTLQTIEIPKDDFTLKQARFWLSENDYDHTNYRLTKNFRRFMQVDPILGAKYYSEKLDDGIVLVYQNY